MCILYINFANYLTVNIDKKASMEMHFRNINIIVQKKKKKKKKKKKIMFHELMITKSLSCNYM
jgi:hypothetical protein